MPKCSHSGCTLLDDTSKMIQEVSVKLVVFVSLIKILCVQCIVCQIPDAACIPDGTKYESTDSWFRSGDNNN